MDKIIERIEREAGIPGLAALLAERLEPTDLQSLLLEVARRRTQRRSPGDVLADYETNRLVRPSRISPTALTAWETVAWKTLPAEFEPLALSPLAPLGACSVVAAVDQDKVVTTIRTAEVVSDATNILALECAVRRRALLRAAPRSAEAVHLATSHRLLRPLRPPHPRMAAHFALFGLCSAGRDTGSLQFELSTLRRHLSFYLTALRTYGGESVPLRVSLSDFAPEPRIAPLETELLAPLRSAFPGVECVFDAERLGGRGYYRDLCFHIDLLRPDGEIIQLADGGSVDWTQKYLNSAKERLIISGIGSDRVCSL